MLTTMLTGALVLGGLGTVHCVAMCGGFAGLSQAASRVQGDASSGSPGSPGASGSSGLEMSKTPDVASSRLVRRGARPTVLLLAQNAGRIGSYTMAGAIAGALGGAANRAVVRGQSMLEVLAGVLLLGAGLFILGLFPGYAGIERVGAPIFRRLGPLARRLLPLRTPLQALLFGMAWGFLPCGLVYSGLALSAASGSAAAGAMVMAAFGLGTLPALLALGVLAKSVAELTRRHSVRMLAGAALVLFGLVHFAVASQRMAEADAAACCHAVHDSLRAERAPTAHR